MAYYADDEENQAEQGSGVISKPGSGVVSSGPSPANSAPGEAPKQSTPGNASPFVGIKEYLNANKPQSGKLGQTVGNFVGSKVDSAQQSLQGAESDFGKQVEQGTAKFDDNLARSIQRDPNQVLKDQNTISQVRKIQKGYQGPSDFQTNAAFQGAKGDYDKAQTAVGNLGTTQGQKQILTDQQLETRGGKLNRGAATLDQALLQASPEARGALKPVQEKGAALKGNLDTAIANALNKVSGAQKTSAESNQALKGVFDQQYAAQQAALAQRAAQTNNDLALQNQALQQRFMTGNVTDQDLTNIGMTKGDYDALRSEFQKYTPDGLDTSYGVRTDALGNFLKFAGPNANMQNVATAEDYARAQALRDLAGYGGEYLSNPSEAVSFNRNLASFDQSGAQQQLDDMRKNYKINPLFRDGLKINLDLPNFRNVGNFRI